MAIIRDVSSRVELDHRDVCRRTERPPLRGKSVSPQAVPSSVARYHPADVDCRWCPRRGTVPIDVEHYVVDAASSTAPPSACHVDQRIGRSGDRRAAHLNRARPDGEASRAHLIGVAVDHIDVLHGHARAVGDDHRPRRVVTLTERCGSRTHGEVAVPTDLDRAELGLRTAGGDLDVDRDANAELHPIAVRAAPCLLFAQVVVAGGDEDALERFRVVADVVPVPMPVRVQGWSTAVTGLRRGPRPVLPIRRRTGRSCARGDRGLRRPRRGRR